MLLGSLYICISIDYYGGLLVLPLVASLDFDGSWQYLLCTCYVSAVSMRTMMIRLILIGGGVG